MSCPALAKRWPVVSFSACRNAGCYPRPNLVLNPTEGANGQGHSRRKPPCTFQAVSLGARKPGDLSNLALAEETFEGKH